MCVYIYIFFLFVSYLPGLPQTKLGNFLETRVNEFLKRQSHPETGDVTIRVVHVSDKMVEVKPGMKSRWVISICLYASYWHFSTNFNQQYKHMPKDQAT